MLHRPILLHDPGPVSLQIRYHIMLLYHLSTFESVPHSRNHFCVPVTTTHCNMLWKHFTRFRCVFSSHFSVIIPEQFLSLLLQADKLGQIATEMQLVQQLIPAGSELNQGKLRNYSVLSNHIFREKYSIH